MVKVVKVILVKMNSLIELLVLSLQLSLSHIALISLEYDVIMSNKGTSARIKK